ncbi:MAG: radical SAM protein [Candidatus Bathyarchaeota archaeon]|nr:radical SAM protein [Candidatus Bathyarchaeota archaeon]
MSITGLHLLITYQCNFECDHCFINSCPEAKGVMKLSDIQQILEEAKRVGSIEWIYFEGGEPFLYYPIMLWGLRVAKDFGFKTGVVTNAYWATSTVDAREWLAPITEVDISDFSISDDVYHYDEGEENLAKFAYEAAKDLELPVGKIAIEDPKKCLEEIEWRGRPVVEGKVLFKGRAADKLVEGLPRKPWETFDRCLDEDFSNQRRVHIDPFGYVHVCQGITIGNMKRTSLRGLFDNFVPEEHPICAPILKGGPAELARAYHVECGEKYVDECHLCYRTRLDLRKKFPEILAPDQMYTP